MLYQQERNKPRNQELACPMCLELVACLERVLCFCHTGNTAVFATSLMDPLGLSRGAIKDGFPVLLNIFDKDLVTASKEGFCIDANKWPIKGHYPAVASKQAQTLNYSINHYMVRNSLHYYLLYKLPIAPHIEDNMDVVHTPTLHRV